MRLFCKKSHSGTSVQTYHSFSFFLHCASGLVLVSTQLYIADLSPCSCCLCVTGKACSGPRTFNTRLCLGGCEKTMLGDRMGEEERAIDRRANSSQPLSPSLSIVSEH